MTKKTKFEKQCKQHKVKPNDVREWGAKMYPQFKDAEGAILQLYLKQVKDTTLDGSAFVPMRGRAVAVKNLTVDEWCIITGIVGLKGRTNTYNGCPECYRKVEGELCSKCGHIEPTTHSFIDYLFSDNTGDVTVSFGPRISNFNPDLTKKVLKVLGVLTEQGTFNAQQMVELDEDDRVPTAIAEKQKVAVTTNAVDSFIEVISQFPTTSVAEMRMWHKEQVIKMPFELVVKNAGYVIDGTELKLAAEGDVVMEDEELEAVGSSVNTEAKAKAALLLKTEAKAEAMAKDMAESLEKPADREAASLQEMLAVMSRVPYHNLEKWHTGKELKTPLDDLIKMIGAEIENIEETGEVYVVGKEPLVVGKNE